MPKSRTKVGDNSREKIYEYVRGYCLNNNVPPSLNDIERDLSMPKSVIYHHLQVMVADGLMRQSKRKYIPAGMVYTDA